MSNDIKPGDQVMVVRVRSCCGMGILGLVFTVAAVRSANTRCKCGAEFWGDLVADAPPDVRGGGPVLLSRLKKIDPPAEGDSLPTRKDLEVTL